MPEGEEGGEAESVLAIECCCSSGEGTWLGKTRRDAGKAGGEGGVRLIPAGLDESESERETDRDEGGVGGLVRPVEKKKKKKKMKNEKKLEKKKKTVSI